MKWAASVFHAQFLSAYNLKLAFCNDSDRRNIKTVGLSAVTGEGMSKLFSKIDEAALEFKECYLPDLARYEMITLSETSTAFLTYFIFFFANTYQSFTRNAD
jgi:hypothetical protein